MSVVTSFKNARSCETSSTVCLYVLRYSCNHRTASRSRWLVGSSRSRRSGSIKRAEARATRIRHPPLKSQVEDACISRLNWRPFRMAAALNCESKTKKADGERWMRADEGRGENSNKARRTEQS